MILDQLSNQHLYRRGDAWEKAFSFLESLTAETKDGRYDIQGDDIFAMVMTYTTKQVDQAILETHLEYVDVQMLLRGEELCAWFPATGLAVKTPYDQTKDAAFYQAISPAPAQIRLDPGRFVVFFPEDAHMPSLLASGAPEEIRKVVVKIRTHLLSN